MPQRVDIPGVGVVEFPDSMNQAAIDAAAAKLYREAQAPPVAKPTPAEQWKAATRGLPRPGAQPLTATIAERLLATAPMTGGMVGGTIGTIAGTPGRMAGATLGGAAGEAARQLGNRMIGRPAPGTPREAATRIARAGIEQGGLEGVGGVATGAAKALGKALIENAVRPTMTLARDFPGVINTIVKERLPVGRLLPSMKAGSEQAASKLGEAARSVRALLRKAETGGKEFTSSEILNPIVELVDDISKQPLARSDQQKLAGMVSQFLEDHPGPLTPTAVKDLKQRAQAIAKPIFKAQRQGFPVHADQGLEARFHGAVAKGSKFALETIPGVAEGETRAQGLIGATRALTQAERRRLPLAVEGISAASATIASMLQPDSRLDERVKNGVIAYLVARGLGSPRTISRGGLALTNKQVGQLLRQFPRLAVAMASTGTPSPGMAPMMTPSHAQGEQP